jgi:hypothetical protein
MPNYLYINKMDMYCTGYRCAKKKTEEAGQDPRTKELKNGLGIAQMPCGNFGQTPRISA